MAFVDNLSLTLLLLCEKYKLSYEAASEACRISSRHFGSIVRKQANTSIKTLEKICIAFEVTPNDLLLPRSYILQPGLEPSAMRVIKKYGYRENKSINVFPVCPKCETPLAREYQAYCDRCGQKLDWIGYRNAEIILPGDLK